MKLTELFNKIETSGWTRFRNTWYANFQMGDLTYSVTMAKRDYPNAPGLENGAYLLVFGVDDGDVVDSEVRGVGNEYKVFANVVALVKEFLSSYEVLPIVLTAKEDNRASLYARMAAKLLPTWSVSQKPSEYGGTAFVLMPPSEVN